jgi:hypothetical protein
MAKENIELAKFNLENINRWIEFADKKASFFLTIALALFSISFTIIPIAWRIISGLISHNKNADSISVVILVLIFLIYFVLAVLGISKLIKVIKPRVVSKSCRKSILYYETIKDIEIEVFKKEVQELSEEKIIDELSDQAYNNAVVASEKYKNIAEAIRFLQWSGLLAILFIVTILVLQNCKI